MGSGGLAAELLDGLFEIGAVGGLEEKEDYGNYEIGDHEDRAGGFVWDSVEVIEEIGQIEDYGAEGEDKDGDEYVGGDGAGFASHGVIITQVWWRFAPKCLLICCWLRFMIALAY